MKIFKKESLFLYIILDFFVIPLLIYLYLSVPRIYASFSFSNWPDQFPSSYINLNLTFTLLIASFYYIFKLFLYKFTKITFLIFIQIILLLRFIDIEANRIFGFSFSPAFFANLELESIKIVFVQYWLYFIIYMFIIILIFKTIIKIQFSKKYKKYNIIATVLFFIIAVRSIVILNKESWHSDKNFASQLFIEQAYEYYKSENLINDIKWTNTEIKTMKKLGYSFEGSINVKKSSGRLHKNLILIYLEGFNTEFTFAGGSPTQDLTPNLDRFALNNMFIKNFFNAVTPTINSLVSSQCGLLPKFDNYSLDRYIYAPRIKCLSDHLNEMGYKQVLMQGTSVVFSGIRKFSNFHHYDEIIGRDEIKKIYPNKKNRLTSWGFNDLDLFSAIKAKISILKKEQPFHVSILTIDTHPPFEISPECPNYSNNQKHNAIHCLDYIIGDFLRFLEKQELLLNTTILITGDHRMHGSIPFGKVFTALYDPDLKNNFPITNVINSFTPDIAPSILQLLGTEITSMNIGKSFLSLRKEFQFLVSPNFILKENNFKLIQKCPNKILKNTEINLSSGILNDCQVAKIDILYNNWILKGRF